MAILIVLGLFAALYMLWLVFKLATFALPFSAGFGLASWLLHHGHGYAASILAGLLAGFLTLALGQLLFELSNSPIVRLAVAAIFVLPAGLAGYDAVYGLAGLMIDKGVALTVLSLLGAVTIGSSAWTHLSSSPGADRRTAIT